MSCLPCPTPSSNPNSVTFGSTTTQILAFSCFDANFPSLFGLTSFNINFTRTTNPSTGFTTIVGTLNTIDNSIQQFTISEAPDGTRTVLTTSSARFTVSTTPDGGYMITYLGDPVG